MTPRFQIIAARFLAPDVKLFRITAPRIAKRQQPGQFVIIRVEEAGERIPLTIAESDPQAGTVTVIVQGIGKTTKLLNRLEAGDAIADVVGPLGKHSEVEKFGTCVVIGGGVGTAIIGHLQIFAFPGVYRNHIQIVKSVETPGAHGY